MSVSHCYVRFSLSFYIFHLSYHFGCSQPYHLVNAWRCSWFAIGKISTARDCAVWKRFFVCLIVCWFGIYALFVRMLMAAQFVITHSVARCWHSACNWSLCTFIAARYIFFVHRASCAASVIDDFDDIGWLNWCECDCGWIWRNSTNFHRQIFVNRSEWNQDMHLLTYFSVFPSIYGRV